MAGPEASGPDAGRLVADTAAMLLRAASGMARAAAESVAGRPPPVVVGETPLSGLVRNGSAAVAGLVRIAIDGARAGAPRFGAEPPPPATGITVSPGGSVRVPLSVDNPGSTAMTGLHPAALAAHCDSQVVPMPPIRFEPPVLTIAPRDFEKLVVNIDIPTDAGVGEWRVDFTLDGDPASASAIGFRVVAAEAQAAS